MTETCFLKFPFLLSVFCLQRAWGVRRAAEERLVLVGWLKQRPCTQEAGVPAVTVLLSLMHCAWPAHHIRDKEESGVNISAGCTDGRVASKDLQHSIVKP